MATNELLTHRVNTLEDWKSDELPQSFVEVHIEIDAVEVRVRALEIAHARMIGWCAGAATVGGVLGGIIAKLL